MGHRRQPRHYRHRGADGSQGIIVIEALFEYAARDEILDGLKKVGLDQKNVKYVILSHAHADHDGGAVLLQDSIPGVHVIYGAEDWDAVDKRTSGKAKHDLVGTDGMKVSVGDASVQIVTMPGHTPGTLSFLFEVRDNGKPLRVAYVGGTAIPFNSSPAYYDDYIASSDASGGNAGVSRGAAGGCPGELPVVVVAGGNRQEPGIPSQGYRYCATSGS